MKLKYVIIISISLLVVLTLVLVFTKREKKKIESIKSLYFSYSNGYEVYSNISYSLECNDKCIAKVKPIYVAPEDENEYVVDDNFVNKVIDMLNDNEVIKWNGFDKSNTNVMDGDSFSFGITTNEDKEIRAHGYMMWPDNYGNVKSGLDELFLSLK